MIEKWHADITRYTHHGGIECPTDIWCSRQLFVLFARSMCSCVWCRCMIVYVCVLDVWMRKTLHALTTYVLMRIYIYIYCMECRNRMATLSSYGYVRLCWLCSHAHVVISERNPAKHTQTKSNNNGNDDVRSPICFDTFVLHTVSMALTCETEHWTKTM